MNLEQEIESTGLKEVDFTCDFCEQTYYEEENVVKEEVFFGKDKVETSRGVADKIEENVVGYNTHDRQSSLENVQILGERADELQALLQALYDCSSIEFETHRNVRELTPMIEGEKISKISEKIDKGGYWEQVDRVQENLDIRDDMVFACVEVTPERKPDAIVCEHCKNNIQE